MSKVYKDKYYGWVISDTIDIGDNRRLEIKTRKDGKNVSTFATVSTVKNGFSTFALFQDFYKKYQSYESKRVTQKTVTDIHGYVDMDTIKSDAIAFYN